MFKTPQPHLHRRSALMAIQDIQDALPIHSGRIPKHVHTPSLRRRRLIISILTFSALCFLVFGSHYLLFGRQTHYVTVVFEDPRPTVALSSLGLEAEHSYHLGTLSLSDYRISLHSFLNAAFPSRLKSHLTSVVSRFLEFNSTEPLPERPKIIWQTNDVRPLNKQTQSWQERNLDYEYRFLYDDDAEKWVNKNFKGSAIEWTWNFLPEAVMKADFLRYLVLLVEGGIYSDIDTTCLKAASRWGSDPDVREGVRGDVLAPSGIIGVEADVGDRGDWHLWWSRPLQIVQWTMSFSPGHPILVDVVQRIYAASIEADRRQRQDPITIRDKNMTEMTVLEWTGPGVFTDAVLRFLHIESGLKWVDLRNLQKPLRAGSVTILPVTGFSPGVGNFGARGDSDEQAMVHHDFKGSWKPKHSGKHRN
ncbi:glycosyltransferase family 32 protein [Ramaria rubella]|nr:glycosyltransferase family 32 protein [Ramaria rubella]